jgi:hypothetical protein
MEASKPVQDRFDLKNRTYAPNLSIANRQTEAGDRDKKPTFFPAVFSNFGEFSTGLFLLVEWIVRQYRAHLLSLRA